MYLYITFIIDLLIKSYKITFILYNLFILVHIAGSFELSIRGGGLLGGLLQSTSHIGLIHLLIFNPPIKLPIAAIIPITAAATIPGSTIYNYIYYFFFSSIGGIGFSLVICKYIVLFSPSSPAGSFVTGFNILILQLDNCAASP